MSQTAAAPEFEIAPGDPASGVVVHVPHASRHVPPDARASILLDDAALERELDAMTDTATDRLATEALAHLVGPRPWRFVNGLSRLVVDPERFDDPALEEMTEVGMGAVYTRTSTLDPLRGTDAARDGGLVRRYFSPYAGALADLVDDRLAATGGCVLVDLHSYPREALPYERHGEDRRPAVCLGTDEVHTSATLLGAAREAFATVGDVVLDEPFRGTYVPLRHYRQDARVASIMVELRRDTYATPDGWARVVDGLATLLASVGDPPPPTR